MGDDGKTTLSERKRQAILRAAAEAFRHEGFLGTSTDRIAERAGVSKRTLYNHFASKDALFDAVIAGYWSRLLPLTEPAGDASQPIDERLYALARARIDVLLDPEILGIFRTILGESVRSPDLGRAWRQDGGHIELLGLRAVLEEERSRGRLRIDDVDLAGSQLWGLAFESLFWPAVLLMRGSVSDAERERVIRDGVKTFLSRYGAAMPEAPLPRTRARTGGKR